MLWFYSVVVVLIPTEGFCLLLLLDYYQLKYMTFFQSNYLNNLYENLIKRLVMIFITIVLPGFLKKMRIDIGTPALPI